MVKAIYLGAEALKECVGEYLFVICEVFYWRVKFEFEFDFSIFLAFYWVYSLYSIDSPVFPPRDGKKFLEERFLFGDLLFL